MVFVIAELKQSGLSHDVIKEEYFFISSWLKESYSKFGDHQNQNVASVVSMVPVQASGSSLAPRIELLSSRVEEGNDELPEYTPGKKPTTAVEKAQNLDSAAAVMNLENPSDRFGSSLGASPPAYTFDTESDQEVDEEFALYIRNSIGNELKRRVIERKSHPDRFSSPYAWLPKSMQAQYAKRPEILTMLEGKSFTVMGYVTAPWCWDEIDRLLPKLGTSADGTGSDAITNDGIRTLKTMASAMHRFIKVLGPRPGSEMFSDLDAMDYEASKAVTLDDRIVFPEHDFDLAQKSYYMLLTYIMGMLSF